MIDRLRVRTPQSQVVEQWLQADHLLISQSEGSAMHDPLSQCASWEVRGQAKPETPSISLGSVLISRVRVRVPKPQSFPRESFSVVEQSLQSPQSSISQSWRTSGHSCRCPSGHCPDLQNTSSPSSLIPQCSLSSVGGQGMPICSSGWELIDRLRVRTPQSQVVEQGLQSSHLPISQS